MSAAWGSGTASSSPVRSCVGRAVFMGSVTATRGSVGATFGSTVVEAGRSGAVRASGVEVVDSTEVGGAAIGWVARLLVTGAAGFDRPSSFFCFSGPPRADLDRARFFITWVDR